MFGRHALGLELFLVFTIPSQEFVKIVSVGPVGAECLLIKQTLDAAA